MTRWIVTQWFKHRLWPPPYPPKIGEIAMWPNTRVVKCNRMFHKRQTHTIIRTSATIYQTNFYCNCVQAYRGQKNGELTHYVSISHHREVHGELTHYVSISHHLAAPSHLVIILLPCVDSTVIPGTNTRGWSSRWVQCILLETLPVAVPFKSTAFRPKEIFSAVQGLTHTLLFVFWWRICNHSKWLVGSTCFFDMTRRAFLTKGQSQQEIKNGNQTLPIKQTINPTILFNGGNCATCASKFLLVVIWRFCAKAPDWRANPLLTPIFSILNLCVILPQTVPRINISIDSLVPQIISRYLEKTCDTNIKYINCLLLWNGR